MIPIPFRERLKALRERLDREDVLLCFAAVFVLCSLFCFIYTGQNGEGNDVTMIKTRPTSRSQETVEIEEVDAPGMLPGEKLDLNTASEGDLTRLPGIGPSRAAEIASWREANGGFQTAKQIQEVYGIGPKTYERIQPYITVNPLPQPKRKKCQAPPKERA